MADQAQPTQPTKAAPKQRFTLNRQPDGGVELKIVVPWADVEKFREESMTELIKEIELPGFRKGNVPRKIAEERIPKQNLQEEMLKRVLTQEYIAAVKNFNLKPLVNPKIHVEAFEDGTPLEFAAETCEDPKVDLKNYKEAVKKIKPATPKIATPGQPAKPEAEEPRKLDQILDVVLSSTEVKIPKILVENEANRLLSQLLDELKRLGVTLDQYLSSRNTTTEKLRAEYDDRAEKDLKLEFLLRNIADDEKITVKQEEVETAIAGIKDPKQKEEVSKNPYLLAAIIRQQKTLEFLNTL